MRLLFVFLLSLFFFNANAQLLNTKLEITVLNTKGNVEAGVEVKLYDNEDDYLADKDVVQGVQYTDTKGVVLYKNLQAKAYYINAQKGKADNFGESDSTIPLVAGKKNKIRVIITEGD